MRKYALTFFISSHDNCEILETIECDQWAEVAEDTSAIVYCLNDNTDSCVGYPSSSLRRIVQNKGVLTNFGGCICDKQIEGYT